MNRSSWLLVGFAFTTALFTACGDDPAKPGASAGSAGQADSGGETNVGGSSDPGEGGGTATVAGASSGGALVAGAPSEPEGGSTSAGGTGGGGDSGAEAGAGGAGPSEPVIDPECDYLEEADLTNHTYPQEDSSLVLDANNTIVICGQIDTTHWDTGTTDDDDFFYEVAAAGQFVASVEFEGGPHPGTFGLGASQANATGSASGNVVGTKGAVWGEHPEDGYAIVGVGHYVDAESLEEPIKYKIRIKMVPWITDCAVATPQAAAQSYAESSDGAGHTGNDVLRFQYAEPEQPATPETDAPELSNIVLGDGEKSLISGVSANVTHGAEDYKDGDMFRFRTGDIDQLTIRLDWDSAYADLDFFLFEENDFYGEVGAYTAYRPEARTRLVESNKNYWLWIGGHKDSNNGSLPTSYRISLCGDTFAP